MRHRLAAAGLALSLLAQAVPAAAQQLGMPPLPPGQLLLGPIAYPGNAGYIASITTGVDANTYVGAAPPAVSFVPTASAGVVLTTAPTQWVRFFTVGAPGDMSSPYGSWIATTNSVRGQSAAQVKDSLALPLLPTSLAVVRAPAGVCILAAQGNAVLGNFPANPPAIPAPGPWGNGGTPQYYVIGQTNSPTCTDAQYLPDSAYLVQFDMGANALAYAPQAGGGNAGAVAAALDHAIFPSPFGDMDSVYNALDVLNLTSPPVLRTALVQLDGEVYSSLPSLAITGGQLFLGALREQMRLGRTLAGATPLGAAPAQGAEPLRAWVSFYGGAGTLSGNGNSHDANLALGGIIAGFELAVLPTLRAGIALGYARSGSSLNGLSGNADANQYTAALHASHATGPFYLDAALGYSYQGADVTRGIAFPGVLRGASARPGSNALLAAAELGYHLRLAPDTALTPIAGLQLVSAAQGAFSEAGAGAISLRVGSQTTSSVRGILGAELTQRAAIGAGILEASLRLAWAHDYAATGRSIDAAFVGLPSAAFTTQGARAPRDLAVVGAGLSLPMRNMEFYVRYDGNIAGNFAMHGGSAGMRMAF
jgi:outer membrane autotransporter protein